MKKILLLILLISQLQVLSQGNHYKKGISLYINEEYEEALKVLSKMDDKSISELKAKDQKGLYLKRLKSFIRCYFAKTGEDISYYEQAYNDFFKLKGFKLKGSEETDLTNLSLSIVNSFYFYTVKLSYSQKSSSESKDSYKKAISIGEKSIKIKPTYTAHSLLGSNYLMLGDSVSSLENLYKAIELFSSDEHKNADLNIGYDFYRVALIERYKNNDLDKTIEIINLGIETVNKEFETKKSDKKSAKDDIIEDLNNFLLDVYLNHPTKREEALQKFEKAVKQDPENYIKVIAYAQLLEKNNQIEKAVKQYKKATYIEPNKKIAFFNLGVIYNNQATAIYKEMNQLDDYGVEYKKLEESHISNMKEAKVYFESVYRIDPKDYYNVRALMQICITLNETEEYTKYKKEYKLLTE